jgi:sigma-B regulation protein RsbU (phosphoserine phosphatase)
LCVPILHQGEVLGVIYGDRVTQGATYQPGDVDFLAAIAQQVGVGLANLRLFQDKVRSQAVYSELQKARVIQRKLLPAAPYVRDRLRVEGYNEASSAVSGDYFDYFDLEDGRLGIIIADVTGHGLPAALVMANLQSAVRVALGSEDNLEALATRVNRLIYRNTESNVFVTAILGVVDTRTGELEYVNAGHPGPVLFGTGQARVHEEDSSLPLGVEENETFRVMRLQPTGGPNAALFYTDGLIEAVNAEGQLLGIDPVKQILAELGDCSPGVVLSRARGLVRKHLGGNAAQDDMTLLAVHFQP